jgi:ribosomal protein L29
MNRNEFNAALRDMDDKELIAIRERLGADMFIEQGKRSRGYGMGEHGAESYAVYNNLKRNIARVETELSKRGL